MYYNSTFFNCTIDGTCEQSIGYINSKIGRYIFICISALGVITNSLIIIYNCLRKNKSKNRKASMRKIFLIFPFTDFLTSIYWLYIWIKYYKLGKMEKDIKGCAISGLIYLEVTTFQFALINIILFHFRKINTNPIQGILKPDRRVIIYVLICFFFGALVSGISEYLQIEGRSPLNTCFINMKYSGAKAYIFFVPIICIIIAIVQLIHDLFFTKMFNSDKGIRRIHRKNSCYVFIFCLLHVPVIIIMLFSLFLKDGERINKIIISIVTILTCLIPLLMSMLRQIQGLSHLEFINDCIKKKKRAQIFTNKTLNNTKKLTTSTKEDPSLASDPFEWLENHVMEYFMRDILLGVAVSLQNSKQYEIFSNDDMDLTSQDFKHYSKYEINFQNYRKYELNDDTVEKSDYLNVKVIDYAPRAFYYLRQLEKIDLDEMIESFLPKNNSQGIKRSAGKSGSFFISTDDNKYMIKTLKSDELELLKHAFLKQYVEHIRKNPDSLLCRLYGMYNIILGQGDEILIIVMRNVIGDFKDNTIVKFDLKGSTYKRKANFDMSNNNNVMKDLDFNEFEKRLMLSLSSIKKLRDITKNDSIFLSNSELMDYSLFLVKLTLSKEEAEDAFGDNITEKQDNDVIQIISDKNNNIKNKSRKRKKITYHGEGNIHDVTHYKQYLFPSLNQGTAYIISIIDYFQIFNFFKYVESSLKTNFFQKKKKKAISCVDPVTYSNRFIRYIFSLTDVKQFLSNEIQEAPNEEEKEDLEISDDDSEEESSILKKSRKMPLSLVNKQNDNQLLLPIEIKPDIQSYRINTSATSCMRAASVPFFSHYTKIHHPPCT